MEKRTIWHTGICLVLVCLIWGGYFVAKAFGIDRMIEVKEDDFSWVFQVDSIKEEGKEFVLQGFAFALDMDAEKEAFEIVLEDMESGKRFFPKMEYVEREDVNEYFLCEYDYVQSGFEATINAKKVEIEKNNYEVLLRVADERRTYRTGIHILDGKVSYVSYVEDSESVVDDEIRQVVSDGKLIRSIEEQGVYVYQYKGSLYCLMEEKYKHNQEYFNRIVLCLWTTQRKKLPVSIYEAGGTRDELHVYFDDENKVGQYYVCKIELPTSYSITRILLGNYYGGHWVWSETIRPYYEFE